MKITVQKPLLCVAIVGLLQSYAKTLDLSTITLGSGILITTAAYLMIWNKTCQQDTHNDQGPTQSFKDELGIALFGSVLCTVPGIYDLISTSITKLSNPTDTKNQKQTQEQKWTKALEEWKKEQDQKQTKEQAKWQESCQKFTQDLKIQKLIQSEMQAQTPKTLKEKNDNPQETLRAKLYWKNETITELGEHTQILKYLIENGYDTIEKIKKVWNNNENVFDKLTRKTPKGPLTIDPEQAKMLRDALCLEKAIEERRNTRYEYC